MDALFHLYEKVPAGYKWPVEFCVVTTVALYVVSLVTSNVSQVDRVWTFLPTIYTAYYALLPLWPQEPLFFLCPYTPKSMGWVVARDFSPRALLMWMLTLIWMSRLSYNTYRRGLFKLQDEDYRWAVLRTKLPVWLFQVVNLTFIAATQNVLLLLLAFPTQIASTVQPHYPLVLSDILLAALALIDLAFEFTADNQQWAFHQYKHAYLASKNGTSSFEPYDKQKQWPGARLDFTPEDAKRGFITRGLWAYSRHPNFFCEQSFWWIITFFPILSPDSPHLSIVSRPSLAIIFDNLFYLLPALSLSALFVSSTIFTESISKGKYPKEYAAYQQRVAMFIPVGTWEKRLLLNWQGKRKEVEEVVWGSKGKNE